LDVVRRLPEHCRAEVLDGALIVHPRLLPVHQRITRKLAAALEPQLPDGWQLETDIDVMLAENPLDYLTPDIVVFRADLPLTTRPIPGGTILLVVEVVSKGSRREDRGAKPLAYAEGGIPHFWRLEGPASGMPSITVHTYALRGNSDLYEPTGVYENQLVATVEHQIEIDLTKLT
jgi:Uma2 family endonuclease